MLYVSAWYYNKNFYEISEIHEELDLVYFSELNKWDLIDLTLHLYIVSYSKEHQIPITFSNEYCKTMFNLWDCIGRNKN